MIGCSKVVRSNHQLAGRAFTYRPNNQVYRRRTRLVASAEGMSISKRARRAQLVLFGDSLTQAGFSEGGWAASLAFQYQRSADIILRGYSGYNTRWALNILPDLFPADQDFSAPDLVTVFLGANDAVLPDMGEPSRQHVPLDEYKKNLTAIINRVRQMSTTKPPHVLLITPPPVDEEHWAEFAAANYGVPADTKSRRNAHTELYAKAVIQVGAETSTPVVDLYTHFMQLPDWQSYLYDGLHMFPKGNSLVFQAVEKAIGEHFPSLKADVLPMDYPDHKDIDPANHAAAFSALR
mmetsp:Transcript_23876/g.52157  ORF Transcript_23876/g.52157 Transcript_23876/m.52157 type:complete len:293 (-) Transcript_23876:194-1072(-)